MTKAQLENKVNEVLSRAVARQPIEDSHVECKTDWPDDYPRTARQLAASANAARWDPVIWLIGVGERDAAVPGADQSELSNWYAQVQREFDGVAPSLSMSIAVRWGTVTVVALLFETDRPPYVVKMGPGRMDVPWREGTGTRSAHRAELLRLLLPTQKLPEIEIRRNRGRLHQPHPPNHPNWSCDAYIKLYVCPTGTDPVTIVYHRCQMQMRTSATAEWIPFTDVSVHRPRGGNRSTSTTAYEAVINGPGLFTVSGGNNAIPELLVPRSFGEADVHLKLGFSDRELTWSTALRMKRRPDEDGVFHWGADEE